jgi:hypothetical protein
LGYFFHGTSYALILAKDELGYILGDSFTNSPGRPAAQQADLQGLALFKSLGWSKP